MSNLSELLPAGAGAKSASFVASGTLPSGTTVALNSDGTVSAVASDGIPQELGSAVLFESGQTRGISSAYDSVSNKVIIIYQDNGNSSYPTAVIGTVSGISISFGSPVVIASSSNNNFTSVAFDPVLNKAVIYHSAGGFGELVVGTVSGTSISFGTGTYLGTGGGAYQTSLVYHPVIGKVVAFFLDGLQSRGDAKIATISGTSISVSTAFTFNTSVVSYPSAVYDPVNNKIVVAYTDGGNSGYGTSVVANVISGSSITFGSQVVFESASSTFSSTCYDSKNEKVVVAYRDQGNAGRGTARVGTVTGSGISFGAETLFETTSTSYISSAYNSYAEKVVICYDSTSGLSNSIVGTVSGTSISFGAKIDLSVEAVSTFTMYDPTSLKIVISTGANTGTSRVLQNEGTNSSNFIGITDQAIADTATGSVIIKGGVSDKVTGLTTGADYYVQSDGTLSTTVSLAPLGKALSSTSILLEG